MLSLTSITRAKSRFRNLKRVNKSEDSKKTKFPSLSPQDLVPTQLTSLRFLKKNIDGALAVWANLSHSVTTVIMVLPSSPLSSLLKRTMPIRWICVDASSQRMLLSVMAKPASAWKITKLPALSPMRILKILEQWKLIANKKRTDLEKWSIVNCVDELSY